MSSSRNPVVEEVKRLRKSLIPISEKYHGVTDQISAKNTLFPFVLLLGNHSSGKSSFINHILKRKVQMTGVAPTDDNFTIIGPGEADIDRNGPALVGDPDLGFSDLKSFGPVLVNHTHLKVRADTAISDFMLVDSPGMIDSPVTDNTPSDGPVGMDRGYNFEGVVRWYAERADVILLFFDPDKPGTTGETLSILTTALVGLDHKLYIILNKADQFRKIHDFARAYGSLCWNLSKVIPRKDLPRIHTMCLPMKTNTGIGSSTTNSNQNSNSQLDSLTYTTTTTNSNTTTATTTTSEPGIITSQSPSPILMEQQYLPTGTSASTETKLPTSAEKLMISIPMSESPPVYHNNNSNSSMNTICKQQQQQERPPPKTFFEQGINDLEESRAEIELETFNAPRRRVDNEISRLTEAVSALYMHCNIVDRVIEIYQNKLWRARGILAVTYLMSIGITVGVSYLFDFVLAASTTSIDTIETVKSDSLENKSVVGGNTATTTTSGHTRSSGSTNPSLRGSASGMGRSGSSSSRHSPTATTTSAPPLSTPHSPDTSPSIFTELWNFKSKPIVVGWTAVVGLITSASLTAWEHFSLTNLLHTFNEKITYINIYEEIYHKEISANDEFTIGLGKLVIDNMSANLNSDIIQILQRVEKSEFSALQRILKDDISHLRRRASPDYPSFSPRNRISSSNSSSNIAYSTNTTMSSSSTDYIADNSSVLAHGAHRNARTSIHPQLHVHFSPSTNTSPITTKEMIQKKRSLRTHFPQHQHTSSSTSSSSDAFTPAEAIMQAQEMAAIIADDVVTAAVIEHSTTITAATATEDQAPSLQQQS